MTFHIRIEFLGHLFKGNHLSYGKIYPVLGKCLVFHDYESPLCSTTQSMSIPPEVSIPSTISSPSFSLSSANFSLFWSVCFGLNSLNRIFYENFEFKHGDRFTLISLNSTSVYSGASMKVVLKRPEPKVKCVHGDLEHFMQKTSPMLKKIPISNYASD